MSERIEFLAREYTRAELIEALKQQAALQEDPPKSEPVFEPIDIDGCPDIRLEELGFSQRTFNLLRRNNLYRLLYILECSLEELAGTRGMGTRSLAEVVSKLEEFGYCLHSTGRSHESGRLIAWLRQSHSINIVQCTYGCLPYGFGSTYRHFYIKAVEALKQRNIAHPESFLDDHHFSPPIGW